MSRSRLQVALAALLGLTLACTALWSFPPQAVTAENAQATSTPAPRRATLRLQTHGGCPSGDWSAVDVNRPQSVFLLRISPDTRFINTTCLDMRVGDVFIVEFPAIIPFTPGVMPVYPALSIEKFVTPTPSGLTLNAIDFRGTLLSLPRPNPNGSWDMFFNTEVSGQISVTVPSAALVLPNIAAATAGSKADVRAQRAANTWIAQRVQIITESSEIGFSGLIENLPLSSLVGTWKIAGRLVDVIDLNVIKGEPKLYRRATVIARQNGTRLEAVEIKIDETDALALSFEVIGRGGFDREPYTNKSYIGGCVVIYVDPSVPPPAQGWLSLNTLTVKASGSRPLGITARLTANKVMEHSVNYGLRDIEILGYIDQRQDHPNGTDVQLQIAGIVIQAAKTLDSIGQAVVGSVIRIRGACGNENHVLATTVSVMSTQSVDFRGTIEEIETTNLYDVYSIRPSGRNDTQRVIRPVSVPVIGRNDPVVGACINGNGIYLQDSSIQAQRVEVVQCAPAAFAPPPSPTATESVPPATTPAAGGPAENYLAHPTPTPRYGDSAIAPVPVEQAPATPYPTSTPWPSGWR